MPENDVHSKNYPTLMQATTAMVFWGVHLTCLLALWVGVSWVAVAVCLALYAVRMFSITGGYHRYFSHRSFQTSRIFQFLLGLLGCTAAQKGAIWWASHHRGHHNHSDTERDPHSPKVFGFYYAHIGWVLSKKNKHTETALVTDLTKFPELRLLGRLYMLPPIVLAVSTFYVGAWLEQAFPNLQTSGPQMLVWGFFISTVLLYHGTFCINSLTHVIGKRRFNTPDDSRNHWLLALITFGEGWHNNHHRYQSSERQGMYWWEIDISHYVLVALSKLGLVWGLRSHPQMMYEEAESARLSA